MGALSFASKHADGGYADHLGTSTTDDAHTDVTIHHETGSFAAGRFDDPARSLYGMDATIYQLSEDGVPMSVFAADTLPSDGSFRPRFTSQFSGLDGFDADADMVAGCGIYRGGNLTFPMADGSSKTLVNAKVRWHDGFVTKVNMATNKAEWVTNVGLTHPLNTR